MNTVRRGLLLVPLTTAVILGASTPGWAAFGDTVPVARTIRTITVAAPATATVNDTCTTTTKNTMLPVSASWTASASRGASDYLVNAHLSEGTAYPMAQTAPGTLTTRQTVDADNVVYQPRLSVTTLTGYGWSARSTLTGYVAC